MNTKYSLKFYTVCKGLSLRKIYNLNKCNFYQLGQISFNMKSLECEITGMWSKMGSSYHKIHLFTLFPKSKQTKTFNVEDNL